jgi:hypothetical protein
VTVGLKSSLMGCVYSLALALSGISSVWAAQTNTTAPAGQTKEDKGDKGDKGDPGATGTGAVTTSTGLSANTTSTFSTTVGQSL